MNGGGGTHVAPPEAMQQAARPAEALQTTAGLLTALMNRRAAQIGAAPHTADGQTDDPDLAAQLRALLDPRALTLVRVEHDAPPSILDKIVQYEAVHRVQGRRDLARRLADDRRCYALVHPALPHEPLIFTELALTAHVSSNVRRLLDPRSPVRDPLDARCAVLYSISSGHAGLKGVPLGNTLIARVASELASRLPQLETIATLSPVPGFRAWLAGPARHDAFAASAEAASAALADPGWCASRRRSSELRQQLVPLCAYYLLHVKRRGEPEDAVARFHLRNGARLERINWLGNPSPAGLRQSAGMMVNYLYRSRRPGAGYDAWTGHAGEDASTLVQELAQSAADVH